MLEFFVYRTTFVVGRVVAVTKHATYFAGFFFAGANGCRVKSGTFDASRLLVAKVFGVSVALTIGTLGNISCRIGGFKLNFTLLEVFNLEYFFVVGGRFQVYEKHGEGKFGDAVFDVVDVSYGVAKFLNLSFDIRRIDGVVEVF